MKVRKLKESYKFYTDGTKTIRVNDGDTPPEGFVLGRTFQSNPWNKGLSATTDARVKALSDKMHQALRDSGAYDAPWNKGLTKETDDRIKDIAKKISTSTAGRQAWNKGVSRSEESNKKQSLSMTGKTPYNKGLTKDDCKSLKSASDKLKGHDCFVQDWDAAKKKEYETKKLNGTFNTSEPEKKLVQSLINEYGADDVISPYRDARYPFNCDVYIKSLDLFIEYHGTWYHGGMPYDSNNPKCQQLLNVWKEKAETISSYAYAIYYWTDLDVRKLETFRKNKLNFKIIYPDGLIIEK
jgi:hypothetical protein